MSHVELRIQSGDSRWLLQQYAKVAVGSSATLVVTLQPAGYVDIE